MSPRPSSNRARPRGRDIAREVTRSEAEHALRESEERYRSLVESSDDSIYLVDRNCRYVFINEKHLSRIGLGFDDVIGRAYSKFHSKNDTRKFVAKIEKVFQSGNSSQYGHRSRRDGRYFIRTLSPVRDPDGQIASVTVISKDITERKRAEETLQRSHDWLEKRIEERTSELLKSYKEKTFIQELFGSYLSDDVVAEILKSPEGFKMGGETRDMTVLVSDLRGFSSITESMDAPRIVKIINRYLEAMIDIIAQYEGTIDEFVGDGILVFFGAPRSVPDHPERAVACALKMQRSMQKLNKENVKLGFPQLEMGIGISCGKLVVGNIGSEKRKKYGAMGSAINVAFRLEKKTRPGEIVVTQAVKERIGNRFLIGSCWKDDLKGIGHTLIYQVIGMKGELNAESVGPTSHARRIIPLNKPALRKRKDMGRLSSKPCRPK